MKIQLSDHFNYKKLLRFTLPPVWRFQEQQREEGDRLPKELMPQNSNGTVAGCDPVCQLLPGGSVKGCFGQMSVQGRPERPIPG